MAIFIYFCATYSYFHATYSDFRATVLFLCSALTFAVCIFAPYILIFAVGIYFRAIYSYFCTTVLFLRYTLIFSVCIFALYSYFCRRYLFLRPYILVFCAHIYPYFRALRTPPRHNPFFAKTDIYNIYKNRKAQSVQPRFKGKTPPPFARLHQ